jgi:cell division protein FtsB
MGQASQSLMIMRRAALPAVAVLIIANFLGYAMLGSNGLMSLGDYRRLKADRAIELTKLEHERDRLAHRAKLLDPRRADPDLADEMVRSQLGLVRPDEVVIPIPE